VLGAPDASGKIEVQVGVIRTSVPVSEISMMDEYNRPEAGQTSVGRLLGEKTRNIQPELDLRGLTVEEALASLDKYLDDAVLAKLPRARIIHGKGTGALRNAIRESLKSDTRVSGFRYGESGEGGDGVTVVSLS
ncbi:MAG TPA: endonuclease MutS2, partial [Firmicutes bacterium]|nr:endonuclease MutS2 [Bacillota bacterium]